MKPLDLALVSNVFPPEVHGGYELLAMDVARVLRARGHRVRVLTTGARSRDDHPDTHRVLRLARSFGTAARADRARHLAAATVNGLAFDQFFRSTPRLDGALIFSLRRLGLEPLRALAQRDIPAVVTVNDDWPMAYIARDGGSLRSKALALLDRSGLAKNTWGGLSSERVLWLSEPLRRRVREAGAPLGEGALCAQGVDASLFVDRGDSLVDRASPELLFVGRLHPEKGPELVLQALASLVRSGVDARLRVAGAAYTEAYGASLRALASELAVSERVEWLGAVRREGLPALYARASVFVFVSRTETEGMGLTWLEAMACGVPVVALPAGGARAFFDAHGGVERVDVGGVGVGAAEDGDAIAAAVTRVIDDPSRQRALVAAGRVIAAEHASLDRYVDALLATLRPSVPL
jgi:glycogen(starch) synthase